MTVRIISILCALMCLVAMQAGAQPDIVLSEQGHHFGIVGVGLEGEWDLRIANRGTSALVVNSVGANPAPFAVASSSFPATIAAGESIHVLIVFRPVSVGDLPGTLDIVSNDADEGLLSLAMSGQGAPVVHVGVPDTLLPAGAQFLLPVYIDDVTGLNILSATLRIVFERDVLSVGGATNIGSLTETWDLDVTGGQGQIEITMSGPAPLAGGGPLLYCDCHLDDEAWPGQTTPVVLADVVLNDGNPVAIAQEGMITAACFDVSGKVTYYQHETPINDVRMLLRGGRIDSTVTDVLGRYELTALPGGRDYSLAPERDQAGREAINSYDAALVLLYSVSKISLDPLQLIAADVTGNGEVQSFDVSYILRYRVGIVDQFPVGKEWLFLPGRIDYDSLYSDHTGQDFAGIVYGDVSGNWPGTGATKAVACGAHLAAGQGAPIHSGGEHMLCLPLVLDQAEQVVSADILVSYDPRDMRFCSVQPTELASRFMVAHSDEGGQVRIAMAADEEFSGSGEMLHLFFRCASGSDDCRGMLGISAQVNEGIVVADDMHVFVGMASTVPLRHDLQQNYPNPCNPETTIGYTIGQTEYVTLSIYNMLGQRVRVLAEGFQEAGLYRVTWDGRDVRGEEVSSGLYSFRLTAGSFSSYRTLVLLR